MQGVGQFWLQVGLQNICVAMFSAFFSSFVGDLWYVLNSSGDIKFVPLGRDICFIVCMLSVRSLCSNLSDSMGFKWGSSVVVLHSFSSSVLLRWKSFSILLRWTPPSFFIRNNVCVVGDLIQC